MTNTRLVSANLKRWLVQWFSEKLEILYFADDDGFSEFYLRLSGPNGHSDVAMILVGEGTAFERRRRAACLVPDQARQLVVAVNSEVEIVEVWHRVKKTGGYQWSYEPDDPYVEVLIDEWRDTIPVSVLYRNVKFDTAII